MTAKAAPAAPAASPQLPPGTVVGGRFEVVDKAREDALGLVLRARDQKTGRPIALRLLADAWMTGEAPSILRAECRKAAALQHRNVIATYGVGKADPGGHTFVACEWVDGSPLSEVLERRRAQGGHMSLRGAYNVVAHVCKALTEAAERTSHGTLRPSVVWVTASGRVKVADFGVGRALVATAGVNILGAREQACLAPEVRAGGTPDARSDIFGIGAILYQLLTGRSPADGFVPPSQAHPDASPAIDQVLLTCLAQDPAARFTAPDEVRTALLPLVADAPEHSAAEDFGLNVEVDVDIDLASSRPPAPAAEASRPQGHEPPAHRPPMAPPRPASPVPERPQVGQRVSMHDEFRPSMPDPAAGRPSAPASVDLGALLAKITENDAPRWMVVKDNLDHGPFSGRELVDLIVKGEVRDQHGLLNMDTGARKPVGEWPDFVEFVEQFKARDRDRRKKEAIAEAVQAEKRSGAFKFLVGAGILAVFGLAVGLFLWTREAAQDEQVADTELGDLYDVGEIEISGSAGILPDPPRSRRRRGGGGGGGFVGSYEEAMSRAVDIGSASGSGGQGRLDPSTVAGVMNRHVNRLYGACVVPETRRGGSLGNVQIDIAIAGSGSVLGASARQGSGAFKSCISQQMRRVRFPSFGAPRMGARYSFSAN